LDTRLALVQPTSAKRRAFVRLWHLHGTSYSSLVTRPVQGRTYLCRRLDLDSRVALVRPADVKYYTSVRPDSRRSCCAAACHVLVHMCWPLLDVASHAVTTWA
jgi:hypothetical protein